MRIINANSLEKGLQDGWTRATFVLRKDYLKKLKAVSYWDRKKMKEVIDEALGSYLKGKKKLAKKLGYSGRKLVERGGGLKTKEAKATIEQVEKKVAPAIEKVAEVVKPKVEIPEVPGAIKVRPQKETWRDLEEAIRGGQPGPVPALEEAIRAPKEGSALEEAIRAPKPDLTPEQKIEAIRAKMGPNYVPGGVAPKPEAPVTPVAPKPVLTPEQKSAAIRSKMVNYPPAETPTGPPVTIQQGPVPQIQAKPTTPPGMTPWQVQRKEFIQKQKADNLIKNKERRANAVKEYDESLNAVREKPPYPGATEEELRDIVEKDEIPERFALPKPHGEDRLKQKQYDLSIRKAPYNASTQLRQMEWDKTPIKDRPKLLSKYNAEDRALAKEEKGFWTGQGPTSTRGMEKFGVEDPEEWISRKKAFIAAGGDTARLRGDIVSQLKAGVPNPKTASEVLDFPIKARATWDPRAEVHETRVKKQYINRLVEKGDLDEKYRQKLTKRVPRRKRGKLSFDMLGGSYGYGGYPEMSEEQTAKIHESIKKVKEIGRQRDEKYERETPPEVKAEDRARIEKYLEDVRSGKIDPTRVGKGERPIKMGHHTPFEAGEAAPTLGAERQGVFGKAIGPFRFGGESGEIHFPTLEDIRNAAENIVKTLKNIDIREAYGLAKNLLSSLPLMSPPIIILVLILI